MPAWACNAAICFYGERVMKTTLDLPDDLMRAVKIHAAQNNRRLKDVVAAALRAALPLPADMPPPQAARLPAVSAAAMSNSPSAANVAAQRRLRFAALLAQIDQVPDLPQALEPLAWDDLGLPL
jgi:plasmid stability protein